MKKIVAVFKTHFDYGYTDLAKNVLHDFCTKKLEEALEICEYTKEDESRKYIWTLPAYLLMQMVEHCPTDKKAQLEALIKRGQIVCHALPFTMHTELLDEKLLNNVFIWTDEYVARFHRPFPISAKMTDVPGHTSAIIKPLLERGVRFLHLGKNEASLAPNVPMLFWWEDLQGNRILTMYNKNYGSSLTPPRDWKYPVWLAMCHTYDNVGVQNKEYVAQIAEQAEEEGYSFKTGSLDDFARELLQCDLSSLPIVRGELSNTWVHGNGTYPRAMGEFRRAKAEFYHLEKIALEQGLGIQAEQTCFYQNALIFCEHTFGINVLKYFGQSRAFEKEGFYRERQIRAEYAFAEESWREQEERVEEMKKQVSVLQDKLSIGAPTSTEDRLGLQIGLKNRKVYIKKGAKEYAVWYEYKLFSTQKMANFQRKYLTRFFDWSISDFGRNYYPEMAAENFRWIPKSIQRRGERVFIRFETAQRSFEQFGNVQGGELVVWETDGKIQIALNFDYKQASALLEAGNFIIETNAVGKRFIVEQAGVAVDIDRDIVENGNQILWSMDRYAQIDDIVLQSYDAPLVSFDQNAIFEFNGGKPRKKRSVFVVNLFNNQWGTNFPQWIEGQFSFEFSLIEG